MSQENPDHFDFSSSTSLEQQDFTESQSQPEQKKKAEERVISDLYDWAHFEVTGELILDGEIVDNLGPSPIKKHVINGTDEQKEFIAFLVGEQNKKVQESFSGLEGSTLVVTRLKDDREPDSEITVFAFTISSLGDIFATVKDPATGPSAPKHKMTCFSRPEDCRVRFK